MKTHNFKKDIDCRLFYGLIIVMALLLTTIVYDACGVGGPPPTCSPCTTYEFGYDEDDGHWKWGCFDKCAYPLDCCNGACYYNLVDCMNCPDGLHLVSDCNSTQCQTCGGSGRGCVSTCDPNQLCCYGECYNPKDCKTCDDVNQRVVSTCDPARCQTCVSGECRSKCDSYLCEDCNNGVCETCGGDANKKCCSPVWPGVCRDICKLVDGESCIMDAKIGCTGTCVYGGSCGIDTQNVYSGVTEKTCNPQGCTGDCTSGTTWCYKTYNCVPSTTYIWLSQCTFTPSGPGGEPVTLDHVVCDVLTFSAKCYLCTKDTIPVGEPTNVEYDSCN